MASRRLLKRLFYFITFIGLFIISVFYIYDRTVNIVWERRESSDVVYRVTQKIKTTSPREEEEDFIQVATRKSKPKPAPTSKSETEPLNNEKDVKQPPQRSGIAKQVKRPLWKQKEKEGALLPGDMNRPILINKTQLSPEELKKYNLGWKQNAFNQYASDMMSLHRRLPDFRAKECRTQNFVSILPTASVIIVFHNEAWSTLLRSVHSVLDRSPEYLIEEIILVDDHSTLDHLKKPLEDYFTKHGDGKVKILRGRKREGLIMARMMGAAVANGEVLIFLDSHIEATPGWLEPLLNEIAVKWTNVVTPVIDGIDEKTLKLQVLAVEYTSVGGFDWNLLFDWHLMPENEKKRRASSIAPIRSPTMAGGLFAISRKFFFHLGQYDPGLKIWGGENLELSFKVWMCGGALYVIPCSHVGHIFRERSPYTWENNENALEKNLARLAEVWLDEYKMYFYLTRNFVPVYYGDVSDRVLLRRQLKCHSFDWYMKNVYPELYVPRNITAHGLIRSKVGQRCIDVSEVDQQKILIVTNCDGDTANINGWYLNSRDEIRRHNSKCFDYQGDLDTVEVLKCHGGHGNQSWQYLPDGTIRHKYHRKCLEMLPDMKSVKMSICTGIKRQQWVWKRESLETTFKKMKKQLFDL